MRLLLAFLLAPLLLSAQSEADYIRTLATHFGGRTEVAVTGGRVDILTPEYAVEVERAAKWKNSIGQSLWYSLQTNRQPGIILIVESPAEYKYFIQLNSALRHGGLENQMRVWAYPQDFPGLDLVDVPNFVTPQQKTVKTAYWLSVSSNKRHRQSCRWYEESRGRYCTAEEGVAAGCCQ